MIRVETVVIDGKEFTHTWSDSGKMVVRNGVSYDEAYDPSEFYRTYEEGENKHSEEGEDEVMVSISNISAGTFFTMDDQLFYAIESIAGGEEIIPGVNCERRNIAEVLNEMKGE